MAHCYKGIRCPHRLFPCHNDIFLCLVLFFFFFFSSSSINLALLGLQVLLKSSFPRFCLTQFLFTTNTLSISTPTYASTQAIEDSVISQASRNRTILTYSKPFNILPSPYLLTGYRHARVVTFLDTAAGRIETVLLIW